MQMKVTSEQAKQLLTDQLSVWESARDNYKALEAVQVKELTVEGCTVKIQFNPPVSYLRQPKWTLNR